MRQYLELEFITVKESLPFEYNIENIIDDWVSFAYTVTSYYVSYYIISGVQKQNLVK